MVGHERPAGGREMLGGPPLANAACRVFPRQAISEIEALYERATRGSQAGPPGQHLNPSRLDSSQSRQEAGQFPLPHVGQFPVPSPRIVLKSVQSPQRESSIHSGMAYSCAYWLMGQPMGINEPFRIAN